MTSPYRGPDCLHTIVQWKKLFFQYEDVAVQYTARYNTQLGYLQFRYSFVNQPFTKIPVMSGQMHYCNDMSP